MTINVNANADYNGNVRNAGIILTIKLNGEEIASDFSFEGERFDIGVNGNYKLRVNYHAVYAEMAN